MWVLLVLVLARAVSGELDYSCAGVGSENSPGVSLPPGDIHLQHSSSPLTLTCHLNPQHRIYLSGIRSSRLTFLANSTQQLPSRVVNHTSIQADFSPDSPGVTDVACIVRLPDKDIGVCTQKIYVGFLPGSHVINFHCQSFDWSDLNCTWQEPYNPVPTNYQVRFFSGRGRHEPLRQCPELASDVARPVRRDVKQCYLGPDTEPHYRQTARKYIFFFNTTNPLSQSWNLTKETVVIYPIVKAGLPSVRVTSDSEDSLKVEWNVSRGMVNFPPGLEQGVQVKCEWDEEWSDLDTSQLDTKAGHYSLSLSDSLTPFTECNISVSMTTPNSSPPISSDPVFVLGKTRPAPPPRPPATNIAGFETLELTNLTRTVIVYWQRLSRQEQYGPDFEYVVREVTGDVNPTEVRTSHARFESLSAGPQSVSIFSTNSAGSSAQYSVVDVPASPDLTDLLPRSVTKVYRKDEALFVSWLAPTTTSQTVSNYTVFWCRADSGRDIPHQCDGDIGWVTLPSHYTNKSLDLHPDSVHQIAVAANYPRLSSGLQWTTCTISNRAGTVTTVSEVKVSPGEEATSQMKVRWSLDCSKMGNIVNSLLVTVCGEDKEKDCRTVKVPAGEEEVEVGGLSPFTSYSTTVSVLEPGTEKAGRPSPPVPWTTAPAPPSSPVLNITSSVTATTASLTWAPPLHLNGELCKYEMSVDQAQPVSYNQSRAVVRNLSSFTRYEVRLVACVRSRSRHCVLCGDPVLASLTTAIGPPSAPNSPAVRPVNMSAAIVSWNTDFHLGAPRVESWRLLISAGQEDGQERQLTVTGKVLSLTVDIDSLEKSNACDKAGLINKFFYVKVQAVVRDDSTGEEFFSPISERQEILVPCYQSTPLLLYIFICLAVIALLVGLYRLVVWYRRKMVLINKLRVSLDNRELGPITRTEMTLVQPVHHDEEEEEGQGGGLVGPGDQDSESEEGGQGLRTVLLRTHKDSASQDSGVSSQPPTSPQREEGVSPGGEGGSVRLERSVSGYVSMASQQHQPSPSPGYISLGQVQPPPAQPSTTHYVKFGIEGLTKLEDSGGRQGGQYVKQETPHYCQYSYV